MFTYLTLAQSEISANALNAWLELIGESALKPGDARRIVWQSPVIGNQGEYGVISYEDLVRRIEALIDDIGSYCNSNVIILVDSIRPSELNPLHEGVSWNNLIALLILTFPEIKWLFGVIANIPGGFQAIAEHHQLISLFKARRYPLFDATGLREWVRKQAKHSKPEKLEYLVSRNLMAAAIEEESSYAYLHAYSAYRFGYRADVITSWALMEERFGAASPQHGYALLLEDISLNFPDRSDKIHLLSLTERAQECPLLDSATDKENAQHRVIVTSGQSAVHKNILRENQTYLKNKKNGKGKLLLKPVGGMLDLWKRAGLLNSAPGRPGNVPGFVWPPGLSKPKQHQETAGHGSPGKLTMVAETLLRRAEKCNEHAKLPEDFVKGSVFATDAEELLGGQTPTLTLSAVVLKHELEVKAETAFVGVGYHFDVEDRINEIGHEVSKISGWFGKRVQHKASWDAQVFILNKLSVIFRQAGQFEEEQTCLVHLRTLHRKLQRPTSWNPFNWLMHGIVSYAEWLMASFGRFIVMVGIWLLFLTVVAWLVWPEINITDWAMTVFESFFGATLNRSSPYNIISVISVLVGIFHIGIFISLFYSLISRR